MVQIINGDCLDELKKLPDNSVDAVVTDPPYGLSKEPDMAEVMKHWLAGDDYEHRGKGFMGKSWDSFVPGPAVWKEILRVLKPGGYALVFAGSRTQDLMGLSLRLAGFEIRDQIMWVYGSGFPKSMDVSKAIDKSLGAEREVLGYSDPRGIYDGKERKSAAINQNWRAGEGRDDLRDLSKKPITEPATEAARQWEGWGTALKPAYEPVIVCRKPLIGTVAANVLEHGTGALNIDGCRVPANAEDIARAAVPSRDNLRFCLQDGVGRGDGLHDMSKGRWPANLIHDGSEEVLANFPDAKGQQGKSSDAQRSQKNTYGAVTDNGKQYTPRVESETSAARFFYCAKASKADRAGSKHPTVKPLSLMRYLCRLVTPPGGTVLDPFAGSGTTGQAAVEEGFDVILIEREAEYVADIERRLAA